MTRHALATILALSMLAVACGSDDGKKTGNAGTSDAGEDIDTSSELTISNQSSYAIAELYLSPVSSAAWGEDLLGSEVLLPGEEVLITEIECDSYDVLVVDDEGSNCVLEAVDLCLDEALWVIDDDELAACVTQ